MSWLRRAWLWVVAGLGSAALALALLWRRATRQRDEARAERDAAQRSAGRERGLAAETQAIETQHVTAGQIVAAKREAAAARAEAAHAETDAALDVDELARVETSRRRRREGP